MSDADVKMPPLPHLFAVEINGQLYVKSDDALHKMVAYARAAVLAERERCAKLADEYATWGGSNFAEWFAKCAAAIRKGTP